MLKEARIVMPKVEDGAQHHIEMQRQLVREFGGYTTFHGNGGWFSAERQKVVDDAVAIYDVAVEADRDASWDKLFQTAMNAGIALGQESVYIRYPDGSVCIEPVRDRQGIGALQPPREAPVRHQPESITDRIVVQGTVTDKLYEELTGKPFLKRLPSPGEVWRNRNGALVAVMSAASVLDGGYNCVTISKSESARSPGHVYVVNLDGHIHRHQQPSDAAGGDLISFVTRFDS